jgi:hypothetical protein
MRYLLSCRSGQIAALANCGVRRKLKVTEKKTDMATALAKVIADLGSFSAEEQQKLLETVATFFGLRPPSHSVGTSRAAASGTPPLPPPGGGFSAERNTTPKEFMAQKQPRTDVERVACLAFYLTHYRDTPHFKTIDISKLNTEAAQSKMSNTAVAVDNASKTEYLAPAIRGMKQISAAGEAFVNALPDREAAKAAMAALRPRKKPRRSTSRRGSKQA